MKREDLVRYLRRRQLPRVYLVLVLFLAYFGLFALSMNGTIEKINPNWSRDWLIPTMTGVAIVVFAVIGLANFVAPPKCPHCRTTLSAWLLHIAIASGNCGYCGKSIED
jgi:hypothetical protein